ncbi:response regulator [Aliarcobacter cibarius]|uniref:response regulator n=1 Tax=Aliarcobacter cibarius TaxID=255507 RepID=UPI0010FE95F1|nr:response regulator [Aliarcobacter cibarius]TLT02528.1 response regulator [Aliarcobacter cibarius]
MKFFGKSIAPKPNKLSDNINFEEIKRLFSGSKILLVEDNIQNQEIAIEFLNKANIETIIANNGKEAIGILEKIIDFDAILMDCQMPIMDGYEATKSIRRIENFLDIPIIAMTANMMEGDKEKCISAGMNDYISKPLDFNKFYQTLSKWLKVKNKFNKSVEEKNDSSDLNINNLEIEGIDITEALSRMAGDVKLFIKQLDRFVQSQEDFKNRVLNKNLDVSIREAHTLKGVAGNIGANNLSNIAKELEYNLKVKGFDSNSEYLVEKLDEELQELILKIKEKLKTINLVKNDENICSQDINKEKISKLIEELQYLLDELDPEAINKVNELKIELSKTVDEQKMEKLLNYVNNFDFDKANELLQTIK